jgi:hypothetical protein
VKSRRVILTIECVTTYTLAEIRAALTYVALSHGRWITRIVQVQANAIRPEPKPKGMVSVSVRPSSMEPVHTGIRLPKAKRAKGAK